MQIPTVENFTSSTIVDRYDDMLNPPGLTNHVTVAQVDHDVVAVRSVSVPPVSQGDCVTGRLFIDGALAQSRGEPVEHVWRPDRVTRSTVINDWRVETVTVVPPGASGVVVRIAVTNEAEALRELDLGVWVDSQAVRSVPWRSAEPPRGYNRQTREGSRRRGVPASPPKGMAFHGALEPTADVRVLQGLVGFDGADLEDVSADDQLISIRADVAAGEAWTGAFVVAVGNEGVDVDAAFEAMAGDVDAAISKSEAHWNRELADLFTDDTLTSGALPRIETSNDALRQLYWWGAMGVLWFRRENPAAVRPRHYDTLMPRYWQTTTFIWDYSLSSLVHALSDPDEMRGQILHWIGLDINSHFGTEWLTGGPAGNWYSVNQYAMVRLVNDYVTATGDVGFLDEEVTAAVETLSVGDHVREWAVEWRNKRVGSALADYGEIDNLLECVSTYVHEVASLNAANVWCMRTAAALSRLQGMESEAAELEKMAVELVPEVMALYREGEGFFNARHPDGRLVPVQHCYDFSTVGTTIAEDLPEKVREEMVRFFVERLRTPSWMRALAATDPNAGFSVRPDHQWNGAYPAWPADSARAAIQLGGAERVAEWLPGLARSTNQGPPGQAHMVEEAVPGIDGGSRKAPPHWPYINDWSCSSAGAWCELVIESIFGVRMRPDGTVSAEPVLQHFDPDARLVGLRVAGASYDVDASGETRRG